MYDEWGMLDSKLTHILCDTSKPIVFLLIDQYNYGEGASFLHDKNLLLYIYKHSTCYILSLPNGGL